jgi:hypothetical protein
MSETESKTRQQRYDELVERCENNSDGNEEHFEKSPTRYAILEYHSGDLMWLDTAETIEDCVTTIESSDTSRDQVDVIDLDTGKEVNVWFSAHVAEA